MVEGTGETRTAASAKLDIGAPLTVGRIDAEGDRTSLSAATTDGPVRVVVPCPADVAAARRWLATVRRVDGVEIVVNPDGTRARVRGRRHRLPFAAIVPLAVGLGLVRLGLPARIVSPAGLEASVRS